MFAGHVDHGAVCHKHDYVIFIRMLMMSAYQTPLALRLNMAPVFVQPLFCTLHKSDSTNDARFGDLY